MHLEAEALRAWRRLRCDGDPVLRAESLWAEADRHVVYRLVPDRRDRAAIIAKRCRRNTALVERIVYEEILPRLPLRSVQYYGVVEEPDRAFAWLFLEDASDEEEYDPRNASHRAAAGQWLGIMNPAAARIAPADRLPRRGPSHYRGLLGAAHRSISSCGASGSFAHQDRKLIRTVLAHCEELGASWEQLASVCLTTPDTLVHGDFISKNVKVRNCGNEPCILAYDWEKAGWGTPAEDISRVDIPTYWSTIRGRWPDLTIADLERLSSVGRVFRCIVFLDWIAPRLRNDCAVQGLEDLRRCESWLAELLAAACWQT